LNIAGSAARISVAADVSKMQQQRERAEQAAIIRGEMLDIVDRINRRIKRLRAYMAANPKATIVLCEFYDSVLKSMGINPSNLNPADRPILRDLNELLEDLIEQAKGNLSAGEVEQAYDCIGDIRDMPVLELTISARETLLKNAAAADDAEKYLASTEDEWRLIGQPANKAKNIRLIGIILLVAAALATCTIMPLIFMLPLSGLQNFRQHVAGGLISIFIGLVGCESFKAEIPALLSIRSMPMPAWKN
jgi:hypothetical protein